MNETKQCVFRVRALAVGSALACMLLGACADFGSAGWGSASVASVNCDDGLKAAFKPDAMSRSS